MLSFDLYFLYSVFSTSSKTVTLQPLKKATIMCQMCLSVGALTCWEEWMGWAWGEPRRGQGKGVGGRTSVGMQNDLINK